MSEYNPINEKAKQGYWKPVILIARSKSNSWGGLTAVKAWWNQEENRWDHWYHYALTPVGWLPFPGVDYDA